MPKWIKVEIITTTEGIAPVEAVILDEGLGYEIRDAEDFKRFLNKEYSSWDYVDADLMKMAKTPTIITVYLSDKQQGIDQLAVITRELDRLKFLSYNNEWGELSYSLSTVDEEDWATSWKQYYKPIKISDRLYVFPEWEDVPADYMGKTVVKMDPGMAFGTGSHESTRLCLEFLDEIFVGGEKILDVGCGSGILSIAAAMLGADSGVGSDIDQVAVETAHKNAQVNGVADKVNYQKGSFAQGIAGRFNIVFANIVADAIIRFSPDILGLLEETGRFICSGIIDERAGEVETALKNRGLRIIEKKEEKGWVAFMCGR